MSRWLIPLLLLAQTAQAQLSQPFTVGTTTTPSKINALFQDLYDKTVSKTFSSDKAGLVPASGGSATSFLNGAGSFSIPAGTYSTVPDMGAFGAITGNSVANTTIVTYNYPANIRYIRLSGWAWNRANIECTRCEMVIDIAASKITGCYSGLDIYDETYYRGAVLSAVDISVPHTIAIWGNNAVAIKITTWNTSTRQLVLQTAGLATWRWAVGAALHGY
jgi:hypothetical protein